LLASPRRASSTVTTDATSLRASLLSDDVRARLERQATAFHTRRLELFRAQPGNRFGVEIRWFSETVVATAAAKAPDIDWMQHVAGVAPGDEALIAEIASWYRAIGVRPRFEITPADEFDALAASLAAAGARQTGFLDMLWSPVDRRPPVTPESEVDVWSVEPGTDEADRFASVLLAGHEVPDDSFTERWMTATQWPDQPGWSCYLAAADGQLAGAAALTIGDGVGYFASASTMAAGRRRGCQQALIRRRFDVAAAAGCDVVSSLATPSTTSHRNLERAGLGVAHTNVFWTVIE
jgi:hypothetical protein